MQTIEKKKIMVVEGGGVTTPKGFKAGGLHCGIKRKRLDLGFISSVVPATAAGVYTTNLFQAAPLMVTQESIDKEHKIQALLVNSGNANSCTGEQGLQDAYDMQRLFAEKMGVPNHYVAVTSTGVIGVPLPMDKMKAGIEKSLEKENEGVIRFEQAILTTDTGVKNVCVQLEIDGEVVTIGGAAKGSGMIHPNMATMLGFITTDAQIDHTTLTEVLKEVTNQTFNMITVDGDTSTNDMVLVMANGEAKNKPITNNHPQWSLFVEAFQMVSESLAKQIARDGEGATKLIEVQVEGAIDDEAARGISKSIISSNLVKTAIYGTDPNWGRIVCAIGYSGEKLNPTHVTVKLGPITVVEKGLPFAFDEEEAKTYLQQENIHIFVDLHQGEGKATAWGCDLTYDYVKINASYRT
ncbi:bifunctional ornithine acetyltransferase/N-acetylglutamate synthase [Bacillus carboniphilus]|uniref:Arginine biosynthesis bifunctional protein ArgJ n=1 Tax=Bacillus carboniphilus TaxID=86663 RepID=A0ABN0WU14_9BACI